jgi:hypothetical protein
MALATATRPTGRDMADEAPTSETARIATDLMDMLREIALHGRGEGGKRPKLTELIDGYLRVPVTQAHAAVRAKIREAEKKKGKPT